MQLLKIILLFILLTNIGQAQNIQPDSNQVVIEGQTYKTVQIGNQTWLAENLNVYINGSSCYDNKAYNCDKCGRLYTLRAALAVARSIPGWHLPTDDEWKTLEKTLGGTYKDQENWGYYPNIGAKIKKGGSVGFNLLFAGYRRSGSYFDNFGSDGYIWSASPAGSNKAWYRSVHVSNSRIYRYSNSRTYRFSVRLVKD